MSLQHKKWEKTTSRRQYGIKNYFYSDSLTRPRNVKNKYVILRHLGDMCLFTSSPRASVNKSYIPSLPQNNLFLCSYNLVYLCLTYVTLLGWVCEELFSQCEKFNSFGEVLEKNNGSPVRGETKNSKVLCDGVDYNPSFGETQR
jgi:hypothetical protein